VPEPKPAKPIKATTPEKPLKAKPIPAVAQPTAVVAKPAKTAPLPAPAPVRTAAAGGGWKVQLGAFRSRDNAEAQWTRVRGKLGGAAPAYVASGGVTRLQATGFASRAAAQSACKASGVPCVVVAP
jgi:hypothetical protein